MNLFTRWKDKASNYIDVRLGLLKLSLVERTSSVVGHLLISFIYIFFTLSTLTFIGYGLMEAFSEWTDSRIAGAFMTAGLFALMLAIIFVMRKTIINAFAGIFIRVLTEGDEDDEDDDDDDQKERRKVKVED
jgi:hypothetical protein